MSLLEKAVEVQARRLASIIETWLTDLGITAADAGKYKLILYTTPDGDSFYRLEKLDGSLVSELKVSYVTSCSP